MRYRTACQGPGRVLRLHTGAHMRVASGFLRGLPDANPSASRGGELLVPPGPTVRRRRLGAELRRLREAHSLKLEEVAEELNLAPSTLSRIETGKAPTKSAYLMAMLDMYKVDDPGARKILIDMAREGH